MTQRRRTSGLDRSWLRDKRESLPGTENEDSPCILKLNLLFLYPALETYITSKNEYKDLPKSLWSNTISALKRTKPKPHRIKQKKPQQNATFMAPFVTPEERFQGGSRNLCNRSHKAGFKLTENSANLDNLEGIRSVLFLHWTYAIHENINQCQWHFGIKDNNCIYDISLQESTWDHSRKLKYTIIHENI